MCDEPSDIKPPAPASDYDEFVNWDARLTREAPLFRRVFAQVGALHIVDVGAGSARHAIMFATWGLDVTAVDPDESMLAQAEENVAERLAEIEQARGSVTLARGAFGELASMGLGPADALVCTGNALPHVSGLAGLRDALADFAEVIRGGGALVLHLLNHARLLSAHVRTIPPVLRQTADGEKIFLRVIGYPEGDEYLDFDFLTLMREAGGQWTVGSRRSSHTALPAELLVRELESAGFSRIALFGSHDGKAFDPLHDESVVITAVRSAT